MLNPPWEMGGAILGTTPNPAMLLNITIYIPCHLHQVYLHNH